MKSPVFNVALLLLMIWAVLCVAVRWMPVHENTNPRLERNPAWVKRQAAIYRLSNEGRADFVRNDYVVAEKKLRQSLAMDSLGGDVNAWADLGRVLESEGHSQESYVAYRRAYDSPKRVACSSFPYDVETLTHYVLMCENNGQQNAAVRAYNKATEELNPRRIDVPLTVPAAPQETPAPRLRALAKVVRGLAISEGTDLTGPPDRSPEALEAFQEAAREQPNDPRVQYYLGYGLRKAGQFTQAQAAFQKAAQLDTLGTVKGSAEENLRALQAHRR